MQGFVAIAVATVMVGCSSGTTPEEAQESTSGATESEIEIHVEEISTRASYYDTTVDGTDVEIFAVLASDGTVRLAMNTSIFLLDGDAEKYDYGRRKVSRN